MSKEIFANNASTTLGSAIGPTDTTITVATGTGAGFPSPTGGDWFTATLWAAGSTTGLPNEIVKVTARSGDTMTVVRAQEGTTALSWSVGDTFANYPTAAWFNSVAGEVDVQSQPQNFAEDTGTANAMVADLTPAPASLAAMYGAPVRVRKGSAANSGAVTLNLNGFGAKSIVLDGLPLTAGQLQPYNVYEVIWDGVNFGLQTTPRYTNNAMLAPMAANTLKANLTGSSAQPTDTSISSLLTALGFGAYSLTGNGYYQFPNGFILQWCSTSIFFASGHGPASVSWPITFPNVCLWANANAKGNNSGGGGLCGNVLSWDVHGANLMMESFQSSYGSAGGAGVMVFAYGF